MNDFIFGTLATEALRLADEKDRRGGITHRSARTPRDPRPGQSVEINLTVGPAQASCDRAWVYWSVNGEDPSGENGQAVHGTATPLVLVEVVWDTLLWGYIRRYRATLPGQPAGTVVRYQVSAICGSQGEISADHGAFYAYYVDNDPLPEWTRDAVIYQIFVDRFHPGEGVQWATPDTPSGFYGGTLRGITEKIEYISALGANVIWLTPVFPSPSHHGYDATDLFEIERRLGSKDELRRLLDKAHAHGIRVLLDFVPNHWSSGHPTFQDALAREDSPHIPWYRFSKWPDHYETFFGVKDLPQINLRNPEARQHVLDAARYWLEFGVDGYRVDYAVGPSPDFWADFRRVTRQAKPECWTFGEVVEPSSSQIAFSGLLDGCLDFMLLEALRQTFAFQTWDVERFAGFLNSHEAFFPDTFSRPSFLDNHDMNRILWVLNGDERRLRLAVLCQFTLAGAPVIYYGTEVGLSQERDVRQGERGLPEESRLPMLWGEEQNQSLLVFYQTLIDLRMKFASLRRGSRLTLLAKDGLLAYERSLDGERLFVYINLSNLEREIPIEQDFEQILFSVGEGSLRSSAGQSSLILSPYSGILLKK